MPRDLLLMAISLFAWGVGEGMFLIFQPLMLEKWGANPIEIGAILGTVGISMTVAQAPAGLLADRIGSRPVMWSSWVLGLASALVMAFAPTLTVFVIGMLTYGLTSYVSAPMNSYITSVRGRWSVGRALTIVMATYHLGAVAGPVLGGLLGNAVGLQGVYRISSIIFLVSTGVIFLVRHPPVEEEQAETHVEKPKVLRSPRFITLLILIVFTIFALYLPQPFTANFLQNVHGFDLKEIGLMGAVGSLGNATLMLAFGHMKAQAGFLVGQALVALFALLMLQGQFKPLFFAGYFFIGGYRLCRSMALALTRSLVRREETGFAYGLVETVSAVSIILAPPVAGFLYDFNPKSIYAAALAAITLMLVVNFFLLPKKEAEPAIGAQRPSQAD